MIVFNGSSCLHSGEWRNQASRTRSRSSLDICMERSAVTDFFPFTVTCLRNDGYRRGMLPGRASKERLRLSREKTEAWNQIHLMCRIHDFKEKELAEKSKAVLGIYRAVCWSATERAEELQEEINLRYSTDIDRALIYLEEFAPEETRQKLENNVRSLFETKWLVDLVDTAMLQVRDFPDGGKEYFEVLSKCFLTRWSYTPEEIQEATGMGRSRFYDKRKEAIMIFGIALWGTAIPLFKRRSENLLQEAV